MEGLGINQSIWHARIQKVFSEGVQLCQGFFSYFFLVDEEIQIPLKAFRWRANDGPILNAGLVAL